MGSILHAGEASGPVLLLTEPLSFWGAFDPRLGKIVDVHHPQCGQSLAGHILMLPETRGSGGTPGGIAEALRRRTGPLGIILIVPDINLAIGAAVATTLYNVECPVLALGAGDFNRLSASARLTIARNGVVTAIASSSP
jgi:predicted aconitase with swiveling domain